MSGFHVPIRPGWMCAGCGRDWPCHTKRTQLVVEYEDAAVSLALLMSSYFVDASSDLPRGQVGDMYRRFLGWLPRPSPRLS